MAETTPDFDECKRLLAKLAGQIEVANIGYDYIAGIARGGWVPARILSTLLGIKQLLSIGPAYTDAARTVITSYSLPAPMPTGKTNLVVEDCLESGKSLEYTVKLLKEASNVVFSASIFTTDKTQFLPDFYVAKLSKPPQFPWE